MSVQALIITAVAENCGTNLGTTAAECKILFRSWCLNNTSDQHVGLPKGYIFHLAIVHCFIHVYSTYLFSVAQMPSSSGTWGGKRSILQLMQADNSALVNNKGRQQMWLEMMHDQRCIRVAKAICSSQRLFGEMSAWSNGLYFIGMV